MKLLAFFVVLLLTVVLHSCTRSIGSPPNEPMPQKSEISKDQAHRMIQSYLTSIGYPGNDDEIRSWEIDAIALKMYLSDTSIKRMKIFLAHNMDYIQSGGEGKRPPLGTIAHTPVLIGINAAGKYVYFRGATLLDNAAPCPQQCKGFPNIE